MVVKLGWGLEDMPVYLKIISVCFRKNIAAFAT